MSEPLREVLADVERRRADQPVNTPINAAYLAYHREHIFFRG